MDEGTSLRADRRVTVMGNDPELRDIIAEVLEMAGHRVTRLARAGDVAGLAAASDPALIVLDLGLNDDTDQTGWETLRQFRAHATLAAVPVLVCSGDIRALRARADTLRADPMVIAIEKPFAIEDLEDAVLELIEGAPAPRWDDSRELVLVADADAKLLDASRPALELLGLTVEELRTRSVPDIVAREREWTQEEWQRYLAAREWQGEVSLRTTADQTVAARATAQVIALDGREWHVSRLELIPSHDSGA